MTKRDAIIGLNRAGTPISKIIKQLKVPKFTVYDAVRTYEKQHQSRPREGKEGPQILHEKNYSVFKNRSKMNEEICKNSSQAFSLETKGASASYCPSTTKESWYFMKSGTQKSEIVFSDEKILTVEAKFKPQNDRVLA